MVALSAAQDPTKLSLHCMSLVADVLLLDNAAADPMSSATLDLHACRVCVTKPNCTDSPATRQGASHTRHLGRANAPQASRRDALSALLIAPVATLNAAGSSAHGAASPALNNAWEAIGGGPPDLVFPEEFLGRWQVCTRGHAAFGSQAATSEGRAKHLCIHAAPAQRGVCG
jgi:hypothetical protein